jgi:hypothetical protein
MLWRPDDPGMIRVGTQGLDGLFIGVHIGAVTNRTD